MNNNFVAPTARSLIFNKILSHKDCQLEIGISLTVPTGGLLMYIAYSYLNLKTEITSECSTDNRGKECLEVSQCTQN